MPGRRETANGKFARLRPALAGVLTVAVTLLVFEILLRAFDPLGVEYFAEADRYFRAMKPDERFAYIHPAGYKGRFQGVDVSINSHGFRAPEWETKKGTGVYRVMFVGDSVVFGWGAPQDSTFPARLGRRFAADGEAVEVLSVGVGSWNTRTEYEYLIADGGGLEMDPDAILLVVTGNDLVPNLAGRTVVEKSLLSGKQAQTRGIGLVTRRAWRAAGKRSCVLSSFQYFARKRSESRRSAAISTGSPRWRDAELALDGIIEACRDRGIDLAVCLYTSESRIGDDAVLRLYRDSLEREGIPVFTVPDVLFRDPRYRNSYVDGHANSRGHALLADRVHEALLPLIERERRGGVDDTRRRGRISPMANPLIGGR
jgi:lysophospholipase L1-like esterase